MDFRSQLSAFKNKSSNSSDNSGSRGDSNNDRGRDRSNSNSNNNYSNNRGYGSPNNYGGGGYRDGGGYGGDRRRHRPREWNQGPNYHQGPPTARRRFHPPGYGQQGPPSSLDGLGEMRNLGYQIPRGFPPAPTEEEKQKTSKHLALLAITIDELPYEAIWKGWCEALASTVDETTDEYYISLVCHAKFPSQVQSEWLRQRLLTYPPKQGRGNSFMDPVFLSRTPEWGSVEITRAMLDLLQGALKIGNSDNTAIQEDKRFCPSRFLVQSPPGSDSTKIPPVDHFLYVSESCMPVVTAKELFSKISDPNISWLNARHRTEEETPNNKYEDDQFAGINRRIPGQYRWKGDQWVLLARRHASSIIGMDRPFKPPKHQLWQSFRNINASDEMFFPTALALLGDLRYTKCGNDTQKGRQREEESSQEGGPPATNPQPPDAAPATGPPPKNALICLKPVTYTDWTEGMKNPATFTKGAIDLRRVGKIARDMGCLVARKFATHIKIPGVLPAEQKMTGFLTMEEWESVIQELQSREEKKKAEAVQADAAAAVVPSDDGNSATENAAEVEDSKSEGSKEEAGTKSESLETDKVEGGDNNSGNAEDNDDDDGENQLE